MNPQADDPLVSCPHCNQHHQLSDTTCPHCGKELPPDTTKPEQPPRRSTSSKLGRVMYGPPPQTDQNLRAMYGPAPYRGPVPGFPFAEIALILAGLSLLGGAIWLLWKWLS